MLIQIFVAFIQISVTFRLNCTPKMIFFFLKVWNPYFLFFDLKAHPLQKGQSKMEVLMASKENSKNYGESFYQQKQSDTGFQLKKKKKQHPFEENVGIFVGIHQKGWVMWMFPYLPLRGKFYKWANCVGEDYGMVRTIPPHIICLLPTSFLWLKLQLVAK